MYEPVDTYLAYIKVHMHTQVFVQADMKMPIDAHMQADADYTHMCTKLCVQPWVNIYTGGIALAQDPINCNKSFIKQKIAKRSQGLVFVVLTILVFKVKYPLLLNHKTFQCV